MRNKEYFYKVRECCLKKLAAGENISNKLFYSSYHPDHGKFIAMGNEEHYYDVDQCHALPVAMMLGDMDFFNKIMAQKPDLNQHYWWNYYQFTPLLYVSWVPDHQMQVTMTKRLLEGGADPNYDGEHYHLPLNDCWSCEIPAEIIKARMQFLIDAGADVNRKEKNGMPILSIILKFLAQDQHAVCEKDPPNYRTEKVIERMKESIERELAAIQVLLDNGADLTITTPKGLDIIEYARSVGVEDWLPAEHDCT